MKYTSPDWNQNIVLSFAIHLQYLVFEMNQKLFPQRIFMFRKNSFKAITHIHCYYLINFWSHINKTDIFQCIKSMENKNSWRLSSSSFDRWCFGKKVFSFYSFSGIGFTFSADFYFSFICSASYVLYFLCTLLCKKLCKPK